MGTNMEEIHRTLGRIEGKLDGLDGLPARVRSLEGWRRWINGAYATMAAVLAWVFR